MMKYRLFPTKRILTFSAVAYCASHSHLPADPKPLTKESQGEHLRFHQLHKFFAQ